MIHFDILHEQVWFEIGAIPITRSMATSTVVTLAASTLGWSLARSVRQRNQPDPQADPQTTPPYSYKPLSRLGTATVMVYEAAEQLVSEVIGHRVPWLIVYAGTLFTFIAGCNVSGLLPGVEPPTASLPVTSALALIVFVTVPIAGIHSHGLWGYLKHYFSPTPLMFPLHLISEVSRTFALSMRLFGNMMSGHLIVALLVALSGFLVPTPLMALDLLIGILQAYIFSLLSIVYIGAALRADSARTATSERALLDRPTTNPLESSP